MGLAARSVFLAFVVASVAVSAKLSLTLSLSGPTSIHDFDSARVTASVTNTGDESLKLYKDPYSVLSNDPTDTFDIRGKDGVKPPFNGAFINYDLNLALTLNATDDFAFLQPGETIHVSHSLSEAYDLSVLRDGKYSIRVDNALQFRHVGHDGKFVSILSPPTTSHVVSFFNAFAFRSALGPSKPHLSKRATFQGCTSSQETAIKNGVNGAGPFMANSYAALGRYPKAIEDHYKIWFGLDDATRRATVTRNYRSMEISDFANYEYICGSPICRANYYAFVQKAIPKKVNLCQLYFGLPAYGLNSQSGVILHEISHLVANTDDVPMPGGGGTYGEAACKALAIRSPALAITNADTYEFFSMRLPPF